MLSGEQLIGAKLRRGLVGEFRAFSPVQGEPLEPAFGGGDAADVEQACALAQAASDPFRRSLPEQRARLLETIAEGVFSLLHDADTRLGLALVTHPVIQAVGFTGSRRGGLAL